MLKLDPFALTDVGRRRDHNEDFLGDMIFRSGRKYGPEKLNERGYLFAVADGMGGHASGEVASEMAITTLFERYYNGPQSGDIGLDLQQAVKEANFQVHQAGVSNGRGQMGTTLTLALIIGNRVVVGNVGDSRTYLIRQGLPLRLTHDHSLVQDQIDMGVLTPEQAEHSMIRNVITRAIGHRDEVEPDFFEQELQVHDILLLCSDGLHGAVREDELGPIVASSASLPEAGKKLVDLANQRGGVDNISVMLVAITELGDPIPPILNGRAAFYPASPLQQKTQPVIPPMVDTPTDRVRTMPAPQSSQNPSNGEITRLLDPGDIPTLANSVPTQPAKEERSTKKFITAESSIASSPTPVTKPVKKKRGVGRFLILLLILLLIGAGVASYFYFFSGGTTAPAPTAIPLPATSQPATALPPTALPATAPVTPSLPPTVTPNGSLVGDESKVAINPNKVKTVRVLFAGAESES